MNAQARRMVQERAFKEGWDRAKCGPHCQPQPERPDRLHCMGDHLLGTLREHLERLDG